MTPTRRLAQLLTTISIAAALLAAAPALAGAAKRLHASGAGFGHGVGLSQYGAHGMAGRGFAYDEILRHYYRGTRLGRVSATRAVRVLLARPRTFVFSGATQVGRTRLSARTRYTARISGSRVVISGGGATHRIVAPAHVSGPRPLQVGVLGRYRGALELRPDPEDRSLVRVINIVGLDDYVRGVVSREMIASWESEALKAQAVVARTYAVTSNKPDPQFDHYADTRSQMYTGMSAEYPSTNAAVSATRGQVVTYGGVPVPTFFHSSSGGRTESVENVWDGEPAPYLVSVPDPYNATADNTQYHRWKMSWSMAEAERKLGDWVKGSFRSIKVVRRGDSPRVLAADVIGTGGRTRVSGADLRLRLGLYDTWVSFTVR